MSVPQRFLADQPALHLAGSSVPSKESYVFREPLVAIAFISPWNFPFYLSMRSIAPAIACENTFLCILDLYLQSILLAAIHNFHYIFKA
ncbi:MAG: aldehyde dehydrogenase family protein [Williamsia sp.]|nr:aldehyde dehydrogenase family protein [Williamsia sp.]